MENNAQIEFNYFLVKMYVKKTMFYRIFYYAKHKFNYQYK
jgi:hypothetical protein